MLREEIIKLSQALIKFPSTADNLTARQAVIDFIIKQFRGQNLYIKQYKRNNCPSVVINLRKEKNPTLFLVGHIDVVAASVKEFQPRLRGQRLYGRGACDMKTAVAVMVLAAKYFARAPKRPSVGLMVTSDEEVGGFNGVGYLLEKKKYFSQVAVVPDGNLSLKYLTAAAKGALHIRVETHGKSAHGSRPFLGENAIDKLIKIYLNLRKEIPEVKPGQWRPTMNLGKISGGEAANQVPDKAEMFLDIRFRDLADREIIWKKIKKIAPAAEIIASAEPFFVDKNNFFVKEYRRVASTVLGESTKWYRSEGGSDARFFSARQIPAIETRLGGGNHHAPGEWADLREAEKFYFILEKFIQQIGF